MAFFFFRALVHWTLLLWCASALQVQQKHVRRKLPVLNSEIPAFVSLASGMIGGAVGVGVAYPLDTVKVKIQTYTGKSKGFINVIKCVLQNEGVSGFYGGVSSTMAGQALIKGAVFWSYESARSCLPFGPVVAACISGAVATVLVTPIERVKVVMQAAEVAFQNPLDCVRQILREDGIKNLFTRGFGATLVREVPSYAFYFISYDKATAFLTAQGIVSAALIPLIGGAAAGVASWLPVYPIDVLKTAVQAQVGASASIQTVARDLWAKGGPMVFWDGISPKLARAIVNHAVTFAVVDQSKLLWISTQLAVAL